MEEFLYDIYKEIFHDYITFLEKREDCEGCGNDDEWVETKENFINFLFDFCKTVIEDRDMPLNNFETNCIEMFHECGLKYCDFALKFVIKCLDKDKENCKRLLDYIQGCDIFCAYEKLITDFDEILSKAELEIIKSKAAKLFNKDMCTWED